MLVTFHILYLQLTFKCVSLHHQTITDMKTQNTYTKQIASIMPRKNGTPVGLSALQASLLRGRELVK